MVLFSGKACFSPSVAPCVREAWTANGGSVASTQEERSKADYYFCLGKQDPWFPVLVKNCIAIFHAAWIMKAVDAMFPIPCAPYVLDDTLPDDSLLTVFDSETVKSQMQTPPKASSPVVKKRPFEEDNSQGSDLRPRKKARRSNTNSKKKYSVSPLTCKSKTVTFSSPISSSIPGLPEINLTMVKKKKAKKVTASDVLQFQILSTDSVKGIDPTTWQQLLNRSQTTAPIPRISVSDALSALQDVPTNHCVLFEPGRQHYAKLFRCSRADLASGSESHPSQP